MADPKLRIVNYNVAKMIGDEDSMQETLNKSKEGDAVVGAYVFQEVQHNNLSTLGRLLGPEYSLGTFTGEGEYKGGSQAIFYKSDMFRERRDTQIDVPTGAGRSASRWTLRSRTDGGDLYIYGAHLKAFPGKENEEQRASGASAIRQNISTLPPNSRTIVAGDMNFYSENEPGHKGFVDMGLKNVGGAARQKEEDPLHDPGMKKTMQQTLDAFKINSLSP